MTDIRQVMRELVKDYSLAEIKEETVRAALSLWNVQAACNRLGITRPTMYNLMERYNIPRPTNHHPKLNFREKT